MDVTLIALVVGIVLVGAIFFVLRGRSSSAGLLPEEKATPRLPPDGPRGPAAAGPKAPAKGSRPPTAPALRGAASDHPQGPAAIAPPSEPLPPTVQGEDLARAETAGKGTDAENLPSSQVLPAADSVMASAAPPSRPPRLDIAGVRKGLTASRGGFIARLAALFTGKKEIDPSLLEELEEVMLTSDVGVKTTGLILERLRSELERNQLKDGNAVWAALRTESLRILTMDSIGIRTDGRPTVVLMVGVNGVGKTTTIGKLATKFANDGKRVMLAAGDTFRAAAVQQLEVWGRRVGVEVVRGKDGADPGAVAFDATSKARDQGVDLLLVDTAGRLHTKAPLMDEIRKVRRSIAKALDGAPHETLLVLDATTGQNGLTQAAMFKEAVDLTGVVLTKLDGTAKGGIVLGVCDELKLPVRYIGLGERAEDLREFYPVEFVEALFGRDIESSSAS